MNFSVEKMNNKNCLSCYFCLYARQSNGPQRCHALITRTCEYVVKGLCKCACGYRPRDRDCPGLLSGPNLITEVLKSREPFKERHWKVRDSTLLALKMEEGGSCHGLRAGSRNWKKARGLSPAEFPERDAALLAPR